MAKGPSPHQTASLRDLSWEIEENGTPICELSVLDYPGEIYRLAFLDEKDESDPESFRQKVAANKAEIDALLNAVKVADNIFVLFNLADAEDLGGNSRNLDAVWVTNACLHLLKRLESKPSVEILLTQSDRYESIGIDPAFFSLESIDLIGHDHTDVPWRFISAVATHDSEYGMDGLIKNIVDYSTLRQRASALRINSFDFNSHYKLIGSGWSSKVALDFFGADIASLVFNEAESFYNSFSRPYMRNILDTEFELGAKINDGKGLLDHFNQIAEMSKKDGARMSKDDMKNKLVGLKFQSEYGKVQAKNIRAHVDILFNNGKFGMTKKACIVLGTIVLYALFMLLTSSQ